MKIKQSPKKRVHLIPNTRHKNKSKNRVKINIRIGTILNKEFFLSFLFIFLLPLLLISGEFDFSFNQPYFNIENPVNKYSIYSSVSYKNVSANFEYKVDDNDVNISYETKVFYEWKYFKIVNKRIFIENDNTYNIDRIYLEGILQYPVEQSIINFFLFKFISNGSWGIGVRQSWNNKIPNTEMTLTKTYKKELNFFLAPLKIEHSLGFVSSDLKDWNKESKLKINFSLLANLDLFLLNQIQDNYMRNYFGIGVKF